MLGTSFKNEARAHRIELLEPLRSLACVQCGHLAVLGWLVHDRRSEKKKLRGTPDSERDGPSAFFRFVENTRMERKLQESWPLPLPPGISNTLSMQAARKKRCLRSSLLEPGCLPPPPSLMHTHAMVASHHTHAKSSECALVRHVLPRASASLSLTPSLSLLGF